MPPFGLRHARRVSRLIGLGLALASAAALGAGGDSAGIRVTGVVMVPGESGLAVIEVGNGEQRFVRAGDQLPGIGSIAEVLPTGIRLNTPKGPRLVNLEWGAAAAVAPPSAAAPVAFPSVESPNAFQSAAASGIDPSAVSPGVTQSAASPGAAPLAGRLMPGSTQATPEVITAIGRVAATPGASDAQIRQALSPLLNLPEDARVSGFFPGQPQRDAQGLGEVSASLARGEIVRLRVEAGGQQQMVYIRPGQPGGVGSAGPSVRTK